MCGTNAVTMGGGITASPSTPTPAALALTPEIQAQLIPVLQQLSDVLTALSAVLSGAAGGAAAGAAALAAGPVAGAGPITTPSAQLPIAPPLPAPPTGAQPTAPPRPSAAVSTARQGVLMIGDSLGVGTKQYFTEQLVGQPVTVDATGGIPLAEGMKRYNAVKNKPRVVEMGLFTNNTPGDIKQLKSALDQTVKDARERGGKVVWATIHGVKKWGNYDAVNAMIRDYAAKNSDVMGLVDWEQMVQQNPGFLASDQIHGTAAGYKARAKAFADAAR